MQTLHEQEITVPALPFSKQAQQEELTTAHVHTTPPKTAGKRIVSQRRYMVNIGKKVAFSSASLGFLLVASLTLVWTFGFVSLWLMPAGRHTDLGTPEEAPPWILGSGLVSLLCYFLAWRSLHKVSKIETGVPITRANTANLPPPDTLVRASSEPVQEQQAVLLRAATERQEKHEERLVRAVNAKE